MIQTIIGLNGRLHSGKDTAYDYIEGCYAETGLVTKRLAFADPLKMSAALALGFTPKTVAEAVSLCNELKETGTVRVTLDEGHDDLGYPMSGREFLQRYGTEAHRDVFGQNFWVDALLPNDLEELDLRHPDVDVLVVTDVRFANEAERIAELGGYVIQIEADDRLGPLPEDAHPSEQPLHPGLIDLRVGNNKTILDFEKALSWALSNV